VKTESVVARVVVHDQIMLESSGTSKLDAKRQLALLSLKSVKDQSEKIAKICNCALEA
jgi:hypothetical protein